LNEPQGFLANALIWAVPIVFAIILHEIMHGVVARMLGDDTAARAGRLTLNPLAHIDPFGTIILPGLLLFAHAPVFGYAKPVPVDFRRLHPQRAGMIAVGRPGLHRAVARIKHHQATASQLIDQSGLAQCGGRELLSGCGSAGAGGRANHRKVYHAHLPVVGDRIDDQNHEQHHETEEHR